MIDHAFSLLRHVTSCSAEATVSELQRALRLSGSEPTVGPAFAAETSSYPVSFRTKFGTAAFNGGVVEVGGHTQHVEHYEVNLASGSSECSSHSALLQEAYGHGPEVFDIGSEASSAGFGDDWQRSTSTQTEATACNMLLLKSLPEIGDWVKSYCDSDPGFRSTLLHVASMYEDYDILSSRFKAMSSIMECEAFVTVEDEGVCTTAILCEDNGVCVNWGLFWPTKERGSGGLGQTSPPTAADSEGGRPAGGAGTSEAEVHIEGSAIGKAASETAEDSDKSCGFDEHCCVIDGAQSLPISYESRVGSEIEAKENGDEIPRFPSSSADVVALPVGSAVGKAASETAEDSEKSCGLDEHCCVIDGAQSLPISCESRMGSEIGAKEHGDEIPSSPSSSADVVVLPVGSAVGKAASETVEDSKKSSGFDEHCGGIDGAQFLPISYGVGSELGNEPIDLQSAVVVACKQFQDDDRFGGIRSGLLSLGPPPDEPPPEPPGSGDEYRLFDDDDDWSISGGASSSTDFDSSMLSRLASAKTAHDFFGSLDVCRVRGFGFRDGESERLRLAIEMCPFKNASR